MALVDVELTYTGEGWSPYLALEDAHRLDDIREALKQGELKAASKLGRIYKLTHVPVDKEPKNKGMHDR